MKDQGLRAVCPASMSAPQLPDMFAESKQRLYLCFSFANAILSTFSTIIERLAILIIKLFPHEIKTFFDGLDDTSDDMKKQKLDKHIKEQTDRLKDYLKKHGQQLSIVTPDGTLVTTHMCFSGATQRLVIIDRNCETTIQIPKLRSKENKISQPVMTEMFLPNHKVSLVDTYGILHHQPYSKNDESYRFSSSISLRMVRRIREMFRADSAKLEAAFPDPAMQNQAYELLARISHASSFEEFLDAYEETLIWPEMCRILYGVTVTLIDLSTLL